MADEIDALIEEVVVDAYGPAEQLGSFRQVFEATCSFPFNAQVAGVVVDVIEIDFDGDDRHGLTAVCRREGDDHRVALLDIRPDSALASDTRALIDAYRRWSNTAPLAGVDAHVQTPASSQLSGTPTPSRVLDSLIGAESTDVLTDLLDAHPELCEQAEGLARALLSNVDTDEVSKAVQNALASIPLDELGSRVGRVQGGYVHETDAAGDLVTEALEPFLADVKRRATVGLPAAAAALATGLIAGLYRHREPDEGSVIGYAGPDAIVSLTEEVHAVINDLHLELPDDADHRYWPEWSNHD